MEYILQHIYFYFDDSGVLHPNAPSRYFVYAGYVFLGKEAKDNATRRYRAVCKKIRKEMHCSGEIKAFGLSNHNKNRLYKVLAEEESMGLTVDIERVYGSILDNKKSIHRYKDYVLKMLIKEKLRELILAQKINPNLPVFLHIFVDEQPTSTDGFYKLRDSIYEEVKVGIINYQYSKRYPPLFNSTVDCEVKFVDSSKYPLIQASDILANRIWNSFKLKRPRLRNFVHHKCLRMP